MVQISISLHYIVIEGYVYDMSPSLWLKLYVYILYLSKHWHSKNEKAESIICSFNSTKLRKFS